MANSSDHESNDPTLIGNESASPKSESQRKSANESDQKQNGSAADDEKTHPNIEPTLNPDQTLVGSSDKSGPSPVSAIGDTPSETATGEWKAEDSTEAPDVSETQALSPVKNRKASRKPRVTSPDPGLEILDVLGRGGMGVVYKARQKRLNRLVALKMILSGSHAGEHDLARFQTEAEAVAKLSHPNIAQIYEVGESDGQPFFTLEYVDGGTLQNKFDGTPMKAVDAAKLTQSLARAVHYAHQRNIIHRDLKPANVLLTEDGTPKISDFGLAKDMAVDSKQTGTGAIIGTPSYMAPEQARGGGKEIGPLVDVYALGALLYEALTGRPPFRGDTVMETLHQVQHNDPVPPRRLQPKVPKDLETICLTCLRKETHKRYASAEELANDIERYLSGQPIKARPVSVVERIYKWARRRPGVAALLGLLAVVLMVGFIAITTLWVRAEILRKQADDAMQTAKENAKQAKINAQKANDQAKKASDAKQAALDAKKLSQERYHESLRNFYLVSMNFAQNAFEQGKKGRLGELLFQQQSGNHMLQDKDWKKLQGFEFDYLRRLYESDRLDLKEHIMYTTNVAFRPDHPGEFATASRNGTIIIWNPDASNMADNYRRLPGHAKPVRSVAYHPKLNLLASAGEDNLIHIWNLEERAPKPKTLKGHSHFVTSIAFSPDGDWLVSGGEDRTVRLWDWRNGKSTATFTGHEYGITQVAFAPGGKFVASAGLDKTVHVWNLRSNRVELVFKKHKHWVTSVAFAPAREFIASASWDKNVIVWDAATGQELMVLEGCKSPARTLSFSPDGFRLAASCMDQSVVVWDLATKKLVRRLEPEPGTIRSVAFSEDGQRLASINFDMLTQMVPTLSGANCSMLDMTFSTNGERLAAAGDNHHVYVWDFAKSSMLQKLAGHSGPVRCVDFHPARNELASGAEDNQIILWNLDDVSEKMQILKGHEKWVTSLAYGPEGKWLVSGSEDKTVRKWNFGGETQVWKGHEAAVLAVAVSADGKWIATGGADRKLFLWNAATGEKMRMGNGHDGLVTAVAFSPDGETLASAGSDNVVRFWDIASKKTTKKLRGHTQTVTCLSFHPSGRRLATGSEDRTVKIWDVILGHETLTLKKHEQGVTAVAFRPTAGNSLATAGWDQLIYIWQAKDAEKIGR